MKHWVIDPETSFWKYGGGMEPVTLEWGAYHCIYQAIRHAQSLTTFEDCIHSEASSQICLIILLKWELSNAKSHWYWWFHHQSCKSCLSAMSAILVLIWSWLSCLYFPAMARQQAHCVWAGHPRNGGRAEHFQRQDQPQDWQTIWWHHHHISVS